MTSQIINRIVERRVIELNHLVIEAVACQGCPCGFNHERYRSVLKWHAAECVRAHRAAGRLDRMGYSLTRQQEWRDAMDGKIESGDILKDLKPCPLCRIKYNPTGRHRATLPDLRNPSDFLSKDELWTI